MYFEDISEKKYFASIILSREGKKLLFDTTRCLFEPPDNYPWLYQFLIPKKIHFALIIKQKEWRRNF